MEFTSSVEFIDRLIKKASLARASDIHLQPGKNTVVVRLRTDGVLTDTLRIPSRLYPEILARIKILASLRIDEHIQPQDGRFHVTVKNEDIDIRVSLAPTQYGEQAVLRILRSREDLAGLTDLGMSTAHELKVQEALRRRRGLILLTGPTGSGKTSTLYTLLRMLNTRDTSIITVEEPVEYCIEGITQININPAAGLTFEQALRSVVRQDPDVLMVGEIRDRETARLAVQAALTGHLVFSTLHTNDSVTALLRLVDIGIEPYLVASTVELIVAQRLIRRKDQPGRVGIFEMLRLNESLRSIVTARGSRDELLECVDDTTYTSLADDCIQKVMKGVVDREEVIQYL